MADIATGLTPVLIRASELEFISSARFSPSEVAHLSQSELGQVRYIARREYRIEELRSLYQSVPAWHRSALSPEGA
jgi:uncharacterized protein YfkK (UPF0435 family)